MAEHPDEREVLPPSLIPITLRAGETLSDPLDVTTGSIDFLIAPEDWTPAYLTFQISFDAGATWHELMDVRGQQRYIAHGSPGAAIDVRDKSLKNAMLRFRSGTPEDPMPQEADRTLTVVISQ